MSINIDEFKNVGLGDGGARPTLFEVLFHGLAEDEMNIMRYLVSDVTYTVTGRIKLTFRIYEREDRFVEQRIHLLTGPVTIIQYKKDGDVAHKQKYQFQFKKAKLELSWGATSVLQSWTVTGYAAV